MILRTTLGRAISRRELREIAATAFGSIDHHDIVLSITRPLGRSGGSGRMSTPLPGPLRHRHPEARYLIHCTVRPDWDAEYTAYPSRLPGVVFAGRREFLLLTIAHEARHVAQHRSGERAWERPTARERDAEAYALERLYLFRG